MEKSNQTTLSQNKRSSKHSRNGCGTCKIRRVKCDESKPTCLRCKNFGISCEGYGGTQTGRSRPQSQKPRTDAIPPAPTGTKGQPQILPKPSSLLFQNEEDNQYFAFFRDQTVSVIVPFYDCEQWRRLALQSSNSPIIHHAIIAMGALHKTSITQDPDLSLVVDTSFASLDERRTHHHQNAISHYGKALKLMKDAADTGSQDLRITLIASLLIISFETFHGNLYLADAQIQIALELICQWKTSYSAGRPRTITELSPAPDIIEHELLQSFAQLEIQSMTFFDKRRMLKYDSKSTSNVNWTFPSVFRSLHEAEVCIDIGVIRRYIKSVSAAAIALQPGSGVRISPADLLDIYSSLYQNAMTGLEQWKAAYDLFLTQSLEGCDSLRAMILRLRYLGMSASLKAFAPPSCLSDNGLVSEMAEIIRLSEELLTQAEETVWNSARYTFQLGIILPLYIVGLRCPVREYRDRAIEILLSRPWREGLWDSGFAGRTAQWIQSIEEEHTEKYAVPAWARVKMVSPVFDLGKRSAVVVCHQGKLSPDGSLVVSENSATITW